jgi:hypothetical protein
MSEMYLDLTPYTTCSQFNEVVSSLISLHALKRPHGGFLPILGRGKKQFLSGYILYAV